ncbi:MAG TPA: hypothetical protein VF104_09825 [Burkholderiales bacterium]
MVPDRSPERIVSSGRPVNADAVATPAPRRLNLAAIEASLHEVQAHFGAINADLSERRDAMDNRVIGNMIAGYRLVDEYVASGKDLFDIERVGGLLEINNMVLCGTDPVRRGEFASHLAATEQRFYDEDEGGIGDLMEWYDMHRTESVWKRAAGTFVRILSKPQLFIEGNHRSGALIMSYILMRDGYPPFVLTADSAVAFFNPSTVIRNTRKKSIAMLYRLPGIKKRYARFLEAQADPRFLLNGAKRSLRA